MKSGFVNIFGKPNAGKSTLLNALLGEKLAIVSPKVQTTRHRIKGFLTKADEYQIIFSDTPGIIEAKYKLHEKMMGFVKSALEDADVALLIVDVNDDLSDNNNIFQSLKLNVPAIVILNKIDVAENGKLAAADAFFSAQPYVKKIIKVSALLQHHIPKLIKSIVELLPEGVAFFSEEELTDLPLKFFVGEIIREKAFALFSDEIPYQLTVKVNEFKEKETLTKIQADIIVNRESQKAIILGERGQTIRELGTLARRDIEAFIENKVFLDLFVKVKPNWRNSDLYLKEYGY